MFEENMNLDDNLSYDGEEYSYDGQYYGPVVPEEKKEEIKKKKETVEEKIAKFKLHLEKITVIINKIKSTFILSNDWNIDVSSELKTLSVEIGELSREADILIAEIESLKIELSGDVIGLDIKEIKKMVKNVKARLLELKIHHLELYNARVNMINIMIDEALSKFDLTDEMKVRLETLKMTRLDIMVRSWQHHTYLNQVDFNVFVTVILEIKKIEEELGITVLKSINLETDMAFIESEIVRLENFPKSNLNAEEVVSLKNDCISVANRINDFRIKLENNKHKISEEEYNKYLNRINDAEADLALVNVSIKTKDLVSDNNIYKELMEKIEQLKLDVNYCNNVIGSLYGHIDEQAVLVFETKLDAYIDRLDRIKELLEQKYGSKELDENQYNELKKKIEEIENILKQAREKLKDPHIIKDVDIFACLNGRIDGVEKALDLLENQIESLEKPIKDRNVRKMIDKEIERIEEEIKYLEDLLEKSKDEDSEKYKGTKERLDNAKERLNNISKKYRKKCPLLVRAVKSAKAFFKKHKKACLVVAGLAAFAIVGYHVLIPAIMHGNIMLASTTPGLRGFSKFVNNILGNIIGATKTADGLWTLSSGVIINPLVSSTSLLKGLAVSGISSSLLVSPIVYGIKKLVDKMKNSELKQKIEQKKEERKEQKKDKKETKDSKKSDKAVVNDLAVLLKEYRESGKSLDEFCAERGLSDEDKQMIQILESRSKEKQQNLNNSGSGRGRR